MRLVEIGKYCGGDLQWVRLPLLGSDSEDPEYGMFHQCKECGRHKTPEDAEKILEARGPRHHRPAMRLGEKLG